MAQLSQTPEAKLQRQKIAMAKAQGFSRVGLNLHPNNIAWLDAVKQAHGLRNREDAINLLIAEHRQLKSSQS